VKAERDPKAVKRSLNALREAAVMGTNLMPRFIECARNYVTLGEMIQVLKEEFGEYREAAVF
jgi:methylmalonyl-CoA mutase N-terminal domain/subunit